MSDIVMKPEVVARLLQADAGVPNNAQLPLLAYRSAVRLSAPDPAAVFERLFDANGWPSSWRNGVYPYHHFHSTAHEVLGVYSGAATVQFGGERGISLSVEAGDVVIIPAGVAHKGLRTSRDLGIVGAYPDGQRPDLCRPDPETVVGKEENVRRVPLPAVDPVYGTSGPLFEHWG